MTGTMSDYLETACLKHFLKGAAYIQPAHLYIALFTVAPSTAQGIDVYRQARKRRVAQKVAETPEPVEVSLWGVCASESGVSAELTVEEIVAVRGAMDSHSGAHAKLTLDRGTRKRDEELLFLLGAA